MNFMCLVMWVGGWSSPMRTGGLTILPDVQSFVWVRTLSAWILSPHIASPVRAEFRL